MSESTGGPTSDEIGGGSGEIGVLYVADDPTVAGSSPPHSSPRATG